ncbi:hypothetical protein DV737_g4874, partial [Chaetothyriales sp. CBS 132003]
MAGPKNAAFAEESAEVEVLLASLAKTTELAKRIASSLSRLDASGRIVRDAIGPIYSNTQQLQITSRNIDKVNEAIEKLRQPLDARGQEEGVIRAGPKQAGLPAYLGALKRVDRALQDLTSSNLRSNQTVISEFHSLLTMGTNQLVDLYRSTLEEEASPIEPLHYITKKVSFPTLAQDNMVLLGQIIPAIASAGATASRLGQRDEDVAVRIYTQVRGDYIQQSLENLAMASVSTAKRQAGSTEMYKQGSSGIGTYITGIEAMFLAEKENTSRLFRHESSQVLALTCGKAMSTFAKTLAELNNGIKSHMLTDCFLGYEILELVTTLVQTIDQRTGAMRAAFSDAVRPVRETARSSFPEILTQTKLQAEAIQTLPPDGNTIPLVSQTAMRLQQMSTFDRPLLAMLASIGEGNWKSHAAAAPSSSTLALDLTLSTENPALLSQYFVDVVTTLLDELQKQSTAQHRTKPLQGIFLLNSVAVLHRSINSHEDLSRYLAIAPHSQKLELYRKVGSSAYLAAWREPSAHLLDTISTKGGSSGPRPLSLHMEKEVKSAVSREIQGMIEPLYARFWDRYHEVDKGKGKVVKYSKADLIGVLAGLYLPKSSRRRLDDKSKENKSMMSGATNGGTADRVRRLPNYVQVADAYIFQQTIDERLKRVGVTQTREDSMRIAGVQYIDQVRRALKLPVRTFNTACMYFHKFRLVHSDSEYSYLDAAAASLFTACKIEDTLKKSRDILCAAHNLKIARPDQLSPDDPMFEPASRIIIGLERLMLEAAGFDFRSRHPQGLVVNLLKRFGYERESRISRLAYKVSIDLYRTLAPLKQTTAALAFTCVELAERIEGSWDSTRAAAVEKEYAGWGISRAMVMESLLDLLDLYTTNFRNHTALSHISLDTFLAVRIPLNSECDRQRIPRYTDSSSANHAGIAGSTSSQGGIRQRLGERGRDGTDGEGVGM